MLLRQRVGPDLKLHNKRLSTLATYGADLAAGDCGDIGLWIFTAACSQDQKQLNNYRK
jgi:hypothetical protein